jgi:hypothetical protein
MNWNKFLELISNQLKERTNNLSNLKKDYYKQIERIYILMYGSDCQIYSKSFIDSAVEYHKEKMEVIKKEYNKMKYWYMWKL